MSGSTRALDETHDPGHGSWVDSANDATTDFPLQNLPLGAFRRAGSLEQRLGVAIGDEVVDLQSLSEWGLLANAGDDVARACRAPFLNELMALGRPAATALRRELFELLRTGTSEARTTDALMRQDEVELVLPVEVGDYTDFYASLEHATNVGRLFRPDNPLLPNYKHVPIGYAGRASSVVVSGTEVLRPLGQTKSPDEELPRFGPCRMLDYEVEVGCFVGPGNALGAPVDIADAEDQIFGLCLVNDWSARDIQAWEYQPLGPFLGKSFATSISPWIVTNDALRPFRRAVAARPAGDPVPLPYLTGERDRDFGGFDLQLESTLSSRVMREQGLDPHVLGRASFLGMYWTFAQMVTHHSSNGCNLSPGDLLASGTVSGGDESSLGALLEITRRGAHPIELPTGEQRAFLEDGDEVRMTAHCKAEGAKSVGFGECRGRIIAASA